MTFLRIIFLHSSVQISVFQCRYINTYRVYSSQFPYEFIIFKDYLKFQDFWHLQIFETVDNFRNKGLDFKKNIFWKISDVLKFWKLWDFKSFQKNIFGCSFNFKHFEHYFTSETSFSDFSKTLIFQKVFSDFSDFPYIFSLRTSNLLIHGYVNEYIWFVFWISGIISWVMFGLAKFLTSHFHGRFPHNRHTLFRAQL